MDSREIWSVIEAALRAHGARLRRFVAARLPACDVDDAVQLAALRAVEKAHTLDDPARVVPWLYRIHASVAADVGRKRVSERRLKEAVAAEALIEVADVESELCGCSVSQAKTLRPGYVEILQRVDVEGEPLGEAADALGISVGNAGVRLHRARRALKEKLLDHCGITSVREGAGCRCVSEGGCPT